MNHSPSPLLQASHLTRKFADSTAVADLSLTLQRGEVLGLLGLNGAGKTSTLRMLAGVLAPDAGDIRILGHSLLDHPLAAKQHIGYLPEVPPLYIDMRVQSYLDYTGRLRRVPRARRRQRIERLLAELNLEKVSRRRIVHLSKGYRQRVGIAQALIHEPALIILDEPSSGLDPEQMREMRELVRQLGQKHGVIFSSHLLGEVNEVCQRVAVLHHGRVIHTGSIADQCSQQQHLVRFSRATTEQQLLALPDIVDATALSSVQYRIRMRDTATTDLLSTLVSHQFTVLEYGPDQRSLDALFSSLVRTADGMHRERDAA